jgi:homoserine kinase type II
VLAHARVDHRGGAASDVEVALHQLRTVHGASVLDLLPSSPVATFTELDSAQLTGLCDAFGLGEVRTVRAIAAGTINSNFDVATETGRYFVRVNEGKAEADVAWEARLVTGLAERGVATPAPLVARDGRAYAPLARKWVSAFPWRDGRHLAPHEISPERAHAFGARLAELHRAGLDLPAAWRRGSIYDHDHLIARFERIQTSSDPELARAIAVVGEELSLAGAAQPRRRLATQGIIHGDLFRDNVLWDDDRIVAILDFEQASGGSLAYDLAVCINDWCWDGAPRVDLAIALIAGYRSVREPTVADLEALPFELRAAAARFTLTRITDVYLARVHNPEKDFRAFLARCDAWRGPALGLLTAAL